MIENVESVARTIYFAGGGTGGHLIPGLSVAQEIQRRMPQIRLQFLGSNRPREEELVGAAGFAHLALPSESLAIVRRHPFRFGWRNWQATRKAHALFLQERPAAVVGLGGFACVPPVMAANRLRIPVVLLEQNIIPGRATRWLSHRADAVCISFSSTAEHLPSDVKLFDTGNPVRRQITELVAGSHVQERRTLMILGGSQGANAINRAMLLVAEKLAAKLAGWTIVHQTGIDDWREVEDAYQRLELEHVTAPFFSDMPQRYDAAGLVISRAGATSLAELACAGCPTITIPYPHAADDHQRLNASVYEKAGAAMIVEQQNSVEATAKALAAATGEMLADSERRLTMRQAMHTLARPGATGAVADVVESVIAKDFQQTN